MHDDDMLVCFSSRSRARCLTKHRLSSANTDVVVSLHDESFWQWIQKDSRREFPLLCAVSDRITDRRVVDLLRQWWPGQGAELLEVDEYHPESADDIPSRFTMREDVQLAIGRILAGDFNDYREEEWLRDYDRRLIEMHFFEGEQSLRECGRRLQHLDPRSRHETFAYTRLANIIIRLKRELQHLGYDDEEALASNP